MSLLPVGLLKGKVAPVKNNPPQDNFMTGFLAGMAAGAVGMYLFGTDEGAELREEIQDYWKEAAGDLLADGVIQDAEKNIWDFLKETLDQASQQVVAHAVIASVTPKTPAKKRERKHKMFFKGT